MRPGFICLPDGRTIVLIPPPRRRKPPKPPKPTFDSCVNRFCRFLRDKLKRSPRTIETYRNELESLSWWVWRDMVRRRPDLTWRDRDNVSIHHLTQTRLSNFRKALAADPEMRPATINSRLAAVRSFVAWAARVRLLELDLPDRVKQSRPRPRWLNAEEQAALLAALDQATPLEAAVIQLILTAGLRVEDLPRLRWSHVAWDRETLTVPDDAGSGYQVPLHPAARQALEHLSPPDRLGPVFIGQRGPLVRRGLQDAVSRVIDRAGLKGVSARTLRHTYCRNLAEAGESAEHIARMAGLSDARSYLVQKVKSNKKGIV